MKLHNKLAKFDKVTDVENFVLEWMIIKLNVIPQHHLNLLPLSSTNLPGDPK